MKKMLTMVALLGLTGRAVANLNVTPVIWPTGVSNTRSTTEFAEEGLGGSGATGAALKVAMMNGTTVYTIGPSRISATVWNVTAVAFLDNKFVIPYTDMGIDPKNVCRVLVTAIDGSTTNFCYIGWSASVTGAGATNLAFVNREVITGGMPNSASVPAGTLAGGSSLSPNHSWDNPNLNNSALRFGTVYIATGDVLAQGIQILRVRVEGR